MIELIKESVGIIALITTLISFFPQAIKAYRTKSAKDISMIGMLNAVICALSWIIYGYLIKDSIVVLSNASMLISSLYIVYFKFKET